MEKINYIGNEDTETTRVCGTCNEQKPLSDFYRDGKDKDGKIRYRRDCKECYTETRLRDALLKSNRRVK